MIDLSDCKLSSVSDLSTTSTSSLFALPKAFQPNASRSVGFFAFRLFTKVNFRHSLKTKKPVTYVTGFVASIELHSNQMWKDLRGFYSLVGVFEKFLNPKKAGY
jgi:hypothetical protein